LPLCLVAFVVFSIMSLWSAKYRALAREAFECVAKMVRLSPCDVSFEQRVKAKVTAKLMSIPWLARNFYRHFRVFSWAFTLSFFASLAYTAFSIYNFVVYGSCEPGSVCYITWIGWCILIVERFSVYVFAVVIVAVLAYLAIKRLSKR